METVQVQRNASEAPKLSSAFIRKVKKMMQAIHTDKIKELQNLSQNDKQSLLHGIEDVLQGRVRRVR